jgi:hypothetical protein
VSLRGALATKQSNKITTFSTFPSQYKKPVLAVHFIQIFFLNTEKLAHVLHDLFSGHPSADLPAMLFAAAVLYRKGMFQYERLLFQKRQMVRDLDMLSLVGQRNDNTPSRDPVQFMKDREKLFKGDMLKHLAAYDHINRIIPEREMCNIAHDIRVYGMVYVQGKNICFPVAELPYRVFSNTAPFADNQDCVRHNFKCLRDLVPVTEPPVLRIVFQS